MGYTISTPPANNRNNSGYQMDVQNERSTSTNNGFFSSGMEAGESDPSLSEENYINYLAGPTYVPGMNQGGNNSQTSSPRTGTSPWDPRLARVDGFFDDGSQLIFPFASDTAASAFADKTYRAPKKALKNLDLLEGGADSVLTKEGDLNNQFNNDKNTRESLNTGHMYEEEGTYQDLLGQDYVKNTRSKKYAKDPSYYGMASLMNAYSITTLAGGIRGRVNTENFSTVISQNRIFDIRDQRRFYDMNDQSDILSVSEPTTSDLIAFGNADKWGRTPYSFQDFAYCKYWNIIPNNRLLTLRKYPVPVIDSLEFFESPGVDSLAPISTVVSYFGGDTGNTLSSLLSIVSGVNWKEIDGNKINDVSADDEDPSDFVDKLVNGSLGNLDANNDFLNSLLASGCQIGKQSLSIAKYFALFTKGGFDSSIGTLNKDKYSAALMNPYDDGPLANGIEGPVNVITTTKARDRGLKFSNSLKVVCEYEARAIGGVNPKAALLDILSNCLYMGSTNAQFWAGGYRFKIATEPYPFHYGKIPENIINKIYQGKLFGKDGALHAATSGIKELFQDSNGDFTLDNVFSAIGDAFGNLLDMGAAVLNSVVGTSFERGNSNAGQTALKNIEDLIGNSIMNKRNNFGSITGARPLLTGEPVGNWHLTIGNPLNPIAVIGNLICNDVSFEFSDELGPDDFPVSFKATFSLEHGMPRDSAAIQSMFNRGQGKIYTLPDYISATSDDETRVDMFTGDSAMRASYFAHPIAMNKTTAGKKVFGGQINPSMNNKAVYSAPVAMPNAGSANAESIVTSFTPIDRDSESQNINVFSEKDYRTRTRVAKYVANMTNRKTLR